MDIRKLQAAIVEGLQDVKGQNIVVFNTEHLSPLFERVVIASGTSNRQTKALAASVRDAVKASGHPILRTEGEGNGEWIIVDCGAAVVHLMQPSIREYYHLEEIWGEKPVKLKLDTAPTRLVKAEEPAAKPAARKAAPKKAAAKGAAPRQAADDATPAKAAARKLPGKAAAGAPTLAPVRAAAKRAVVPSGITRTVGVKSSGSAPRKAAAKKAAVKTIVIKPETARKPADKKAAARKPVAKKAAAKAAPARKAAPRA